MDTICFFYRKKDIKEALVEPVGLKSHMLIRVGLNVGDGEWFGIRPDTPTGLKASGNIGNEAEQEEKLKGNRRPFGGRKKLFRPGRKRIRHKEAEELERLQEERMEKIRRVEEEMKTLVAEILELAGEESRCYAVYDDSVRRVLLKKGEGDFNGMNAFRGGMDGENVPGEAFFPINKGATLPSLWHRHMDFQEFSGYTEAFWAGLLMAQAKFYHFVILGTAPCVPEWIEKCASRMKSLKWILPEDKCGPEILEFVEDFYTEYGLAISLQTLPGGGSLKGLEVLCGLPSNILDFTGDACLNIPETARGSVWLDFWSVEEKRRRIESRCPEVSYFSLKEKWRRAQRRCKEPLLP